MIGGGDRVTDTHTIIWHLRESSELSRIAQAILRDVDAGLRVIIIPSIVLVEIVYLAERGRIPSDLLERVLDFVANPGRTYRLALLDEHIVRTMQRILRSSVPDMPDRIIAATALHLRLPLISRDERIQAAGVVSVVW